MNIVVVDSIVNTSIVPIHSVFTHEENSFTESLQRDLNEIFFNLDEFAMEIEYHHVSGEIEKYPVLYSNVFEEPRFNEVSISDSSYIIRVISDRLKRRIKSGDYIVYKNTILYVRPISGKDLYTTTFEVSRNSYE